MLSAEENDLLTPTGAGTPMGELFRRFWLPALLPSEVEADGAPIRFRILGEDLIAFRDTHGQVGFLANHCPHRGASLFFGRNEEAGLRCVYHGWKFDVTGQCVDMPNEPADSNFQRKIQTCAYPAAERGGVVWIYMGPGDKQPPLPDYHWCIRPNSEQSQVRKWIQESNYTQGVEGNLDSVHSSFLHRAFARADRSRVARFGPPKLMTLETDFGFVYGARYAADEQYYWRITSYTMPLFTQVPNSATAGAGNFVVPMDDENSWWWYMTAPALAPGEPVLAHGQLTPGDPDPSIDPTTDYIPGTWRRIRNRANDYLIDREMQRGVNYTGVPGNRVQDALATESMGRRFDHADEHLGTTDVAIIYFRRYLMRLARQLGQGIEPAMAHDPRKFRVLPLDTMDPNGELAQVWEAHHAAYPKGSPLSVLA